MTGRVDLDAIEHRMTTTRFYLAGRYDRRQELCNRAHAIERASKGTWRSTARWLDGVHDDLGPDSDTDEMYRVAMEDIHDILESDVVFVYTEHPGVSSRGGRHVELGFAYATGKRIVVIGPRENVFTALVPQADTTAEAIAYIRDGGS